MNTNRILLIVAATSLAVLGIRAPQLVANTTTQGAGTLAQAPLNLGGDGVPPAFMMAVDDSGSMTFQTMFPGQDGEVCFGRDSSSEPYGLFYTTGGNAGKPRTDGSCDHFYLLPGPRAGTGFLGLPPLDQLGAARSPDFNPSFYNPNVKYDAWLTSSMPPTKVPYDYSAGNPNGNASTSATKIDPRNTGTVNLAANRYTTAEVFTLRTGMFLPAGTNYQIVSNGNAFTAPTGGTTWTGGTTNVYMQYYPATFYMKTTTPAAQQPVGYKTDATSRPVITNGCGTGCNLWKYTIASGNFDTTANYTNQLQNFANWFSYYGNRNRAMVAGMSRSLADIKDMRVGFFPINSHGSYNSPLTNAAERVYMQDMSVQARRDDLYTNGIFALGASGSTPNRQAVSAAASQFQRTDAVADGKGGAPVLRVCQKNAVMLFTDGYSNQNSVTVGNVDGNMGAPFADGNSDTMADIVSQYYLDTANGGVVPLRSDGNFALGANGGRVPVPDECKNASPSKKLDCERRLHLNFYGITLGARGTIFNPDVAQDPFVTNPAWPGWQNDNPTTVDDIWHATVNTRGEYINAKTPADITAAMRRVLASVAGGASPSGSVGLSGARISSNSLSVVPFYESKNNNTDWYSRLNASSVSANAAGQVTFTPKWEASAQLPRTGRNLLFGTTSGGAVKPVVRSFTSGNLGDVFTTLCADTLSTCTKAAVTTLGVTESEAVAYLAGQDSGEKKNGGKLRDRTTRLGDIINSSPLVTSPLDNYGFMTLRGANATEFDPYNYEAYLTQKKTRIPMVYVGANDGMIHGFRGDTGGEAFGYIPATAVGHMGNLLFPYDPDRKGDQIFQHRYFVDGPITVSDVYSGTGWSTAMVGTSGAGGRSVFGLDVSDPSLFTSGSVLWEVNDKVTGTTGQRIGHVLGKPVILPVRTASGTRWKAIFGNGYGSISGKASLFIVDVLDGSVVTIEVAETPGTGVPTEPNGLGNIIALDRYVFDSGTFSEGSDGYADTVYGGDLHGNIWKFDLRTNVASFGANLPLFTAKDSAGKRQPILGDLNAVAGPSNGVMILFGTGAYSFGGDADNKDMQSVYGVIDRGVRITAARETALQQQVLSNDNNDDIREVTQNSVNFLTKSGWYMDLAVKVGAAAPVQTGERMVGRPRVQDGTFFFPTFEPITASSANAAESGCAAGGTNWLYGLSALSGSAYMSSVRPGSPTGDPMSAGSGALRLEADTSGPITDVNVMSPPPPAPLGSGATQAEIDARLNTPQCSRIVQAAGGPPLYKWGMCGRQSWRQAR
ncbi:pilus assembly protein [Lysobacter silvisoli]|uniref:Pilus assembly protein n=1 Tax=Lysobacter silvisoli TaxID=2293254 RepID=A0A371K5T2_9GAMM|nr:PilC/PilY family type IV pilus protein [Lysobacter silvisoli]RDZ29212.1 pilus assembly protein [Lysobacter silvisoli]